MNRNVTGFPLIAEILSLSLSPNVHKAFGRRTHPQRGLQCPESNCVLQHVSQGVWLPNLVSEVTLNNFCLDSLTFLLWEQWDV